MNSIDYIMNELSKKFNNNEQLENAAQQIFAIYQAFVKAGFSEEQALVITVQQMNIITNDYLKNKKE